MSSPIERLRDNPVEVTSTLVTGVWLAALALDFEWWLAAMLVGYVVVVPLVSTLFGADEAERETEASAGDGERSAERHLARLRKRYARGDLDDAAFERKLERLVGEGGREGDREPARAGRQRERE